MTPEERFERIETILESVAKRQEEMAARQQYHDEALERMDARIRQLITAVEMDAANIRRLANIVSRHDERLDNLEGQ
jgi:archaellum component FlaC